MKQGVFVIHVPESWKLENKKLKKEFKHKDYYVLVIERTDIDDIKFEIVK